MRVAGRAPDDPAPKRIKRRKKKKRSKKKGHVVVKKSYPVRKYKEVVEVDDTGYIVEYVLDENTIYEVSKNRFRYLDPPKIDVVPTKTTDLRDEFSSYCGSKKSIKNWLFYV